MDDVTKIILQRLDKMEESFSDKLITLMRDGCAKAGEHGAIAKAQAEVFTRLRIVEQAQAEGKGRLAIVMLLAGAALSVFFQWIGGKL